MQCIEFAIAINVSDSFRTPVTVAGPKGKFEPLGVNMNGLCADHHNGLKNGLFVVSASAGSALRSCGSFIGIENPTYMRGRRYGRSG